MGSGKFQLIFGSENYKYLVTFCNHDEA